MAKTQLASGYVALALGCLVVAGCSGESPAEPGAPSEPAPAVAPVPPVDAPQKEDLLVLAASSLIDAFRKLETAYEAKHPKVDVLLSFAGSSAVALQIDQGAAGDVLATASEDHLQKLVKAGLIKDDAVFAYNELVLAVAPTNPAKIERFEDLEKAQRIVLGTPNVPVGQYADALIKRAGEKLNPKFAETVNAHVVSREANVKLVLAKIELGEADAAIVYRTDIRDPACKPAPPKAPPSVTTCGHARAISIPSEIADRATYPIGIATRSKHPEQAKAFVELVLSAEGQAILAAQNFIPARPPTPPASEGEPKK